MLQKTNFYQSLTSDLTSGLVVFLIALPLCLGVAYASGAPAFSGIVAGVVGGLIVGILSKSPLSVSGPAAGLTVIVLDGIQESGSFQSFLMAVVIAGFIQVGLGFIKAGVLSHYFPSSVIKGMLAAIGIILIMKQIPHAIGYDMDFEGDEGFFQSDGHNTFSEIYYAFFNLEPGAVVIAAIGLAIMLVWQMPATRKVPFVGNIPSALLVVITGLSLNRFVFPESVFSLEQSHLVTLPLDGTVKSFLSGFIFPDMTALQFSSTYKVAFTIAIIASIETLLCIEAIDKLDPIKRKTPVNRELVAQGIGNTISGLFGGIPITSVIVRSSANLYSGARSRASTITHGLLLFLAVFLFPVVLNMIPLSALAIILIVTGFKLASPSIFKDIYSKGFSQLVPFLVTITAILFTDLLQGIVIGMVVGMMFVLYNNFLLAITVVNDGNNVLIRLNRGVSFLNKHYLRTTLDKIKPGSFVLIDGTSSTFIDEDIVELIEEYMLYAGTKNITVEIKKSVSSKHELFMKQWDSDKGD